MTTHKAFLTALATLAATTPLVLSVSSASAQTNAVDQPTVQQIERDAAKRTAQSLASAGWRTAMQTSLTSTEASDLQSLARLQADPAYTNAITTWNQQVLTAKGLPASTGSLLTIRLAHSSMLTAFKSGVEPLVAVPGDDDQASPSITAFDKTGAEIALSAVVVPTRPVLMVDVDVRKAQAVGVEQMNAILGRTAVPTTDDAVPTTIIEEVRVFHDRENWWRGDAEMFSIVGCVGTDQKPLASVVNMPYLNNEGTTYRPNQTLVWWASCYYNHADVLMYESDGDTNYQNLASAINAGIGSLCSKCGPYVAIAEAIIRAMPVKWWTDDPDHVEQWYSLRTTTTGQVNGASGNGWMKLRAELVDPVE